MNTEHAVDCFIYKEGKYLILHRGQHKRIMPGVSMGIGGRIEDDEDLFMGTKREVLEETGISIRNLRVKAVGNIVMNDLDSRIINILMVAEYESGDATAHTDHDGDFEWLSKEELLKLPNLLLELKDTLPYVLSDDPNVISYFAHYDKGNNMIEFLIN